MERSSFPPTPLTIIFLIQEGGAGVPSGPRFLDLHPVGCAATSAETHSSLPRANVNQVRVNVNLDTAVWLCTVLLG